MNMRYKIYVFLLLMVFSIGAMTQQPDTRHIRIVDTLTAQEKANRNPIFLRLELDSLIKQSSRQVLLSDVTYHG